MDGRPLLAGEIGALRYTLAACLLVFGWNLVLPYFMATLARLDATGRLMAAANGVIGGGLAIGPMLAASARNGGEQGRALFVGKLGIALSLFLIVPLSRREAVGPSTKG